MDEVDNIIIDSLKALNCDIAEDISNLKQFDDALVILSISTCLEAIIPQSKFPKNLSSSMAIRLKTASHLAEQIKDIGFKEEIGYQTLLYFNEDEIRRLLIFLIEKLPRDSNNTIQTEEIGYIPNLLATMKQKLKNFPDLWIPSSLLEKGIHSQEDMLQFRSYGNSVNLRTKKLKIPLVGDMDSKNYFVHILPTVTKQCTSQELIPSLLFDDCKFSRKNKDMMSYLRNIPLIENKDKLSNESIVEGSISDVNKKEESKFFEKNLKLNLSETITSNEEPENIKTLSEYLQVDEENYSKLKTCVEEKKAELSKLDLVKKKETKILEEATANFNVKTKTMAVLSQEENLQKLKHLIEKAKLRLVELSNQWKDVKEPLLKEYEFLQNSLSKNESIIKEKEDSLNNIVIKYGEMLNELKDKVLIEQKLLEQHKQLSKNTNRSAYTKNIMEIIGNIKKQNFEMQKILKDTREVQKDINSLTGQIDRSFTICDEQIFMNAKKDETSRKAYKLLVSLHTECGEIIKIVSDIGFIERECRNLQELIDIESAKETAVKLKRMNEDLEQIRAENISLMKQVQ